MQYRQSWAQGADWKNFENHTDVVDPQRHETAIALKAAADEQQRGTCFEARYQRAAQRPPKYISSEETLRRDTGFIVMDYK